MNRILFAFSVLIAFILVFSCEGGSSLEVNCGECFVNEPDSFELEVSLSIDYADYDSVYLEFYKGNVESGELSWEGICYTPIFYHRVPVDEFYSVKATYRKNDKIIIAIDGDRMVSRYIADACDTDCWIIKGGILNAELKY